MGDPLQDVQIQARGAPSLSPEIPSSETEFQLHRALPPSLQALTSPVFPAAFVVQATSFSLYLQDTLVLVSYLFSYLVNGLNTLLLTELIVQLLSCLRLYAILWTAARQASLFFTVSRSLLKFMSIESVIPFNHLILCHPLLLLPSVFPSIRVFSNELSLHIR